MKTLSMFVTEIEENDEELIYYDDFSLVLMQIIKTMHIKGTVINFTDIFNSPIDQLKQLINLYKDSESIIVASVEISPLDFSPETICTEETIEKLQSYLCAKTDEMVNLGFEHISSEMFNFGSLIPFIYPNKKGKEIIKYINEATKTPFDTELSDKGEE